MCPDNCPLARPLPPFSYTHPGLAVTETRTAYVLGCYSAWVCLEVVGVGKAYSHLLAVHGWCLDGWATVRAVAVRLVAKTPALTRRRHLPRRPYSARARTSGAAMAPCAATRIALFGAISVLQGACLASRVGVTVHPHLRFIETMLVNALRVCSLHNVR